MPWEEYAAQAPQQTTAEAPPWEQYGSTTPTAPAQAAPEAPQRSLLDQLGRSVGLAARMPLQAAGSTVGMVGDALNSGINMATGSHLGMPSRIIQQGIDAVLPVPENTGEKIGDFAGTMLAGGLRGGVDPLARGIASKFAPTGLYDAPAAIPPAAQTVKDAQDVGYAVSPSEARSGLFGRVMGAFAGKKGTNSLLQEHNVEATNAASRRAAGLPPNTNLDADTLKKAIKSTMDEGYAPLDNIGKIPAMPQYQYELANAQRDLAALQPNKDSNALFKQYSNMKSFDPAETKRSISQLREEATAHFNSGAPGGSILGQTNRSIADALENNIGNHLQVVAPGSDLLTNFQNARQMLAKQHLVRDAIKEGTGNADISTYGKALTNQVPLTGDLLTMGRIANQAPYSTRMPSPGSPMAQAMPDIIRGGLQLGLGHLLGGAIGTGVGTALQGGMMGTRYLMPTAIGQRLFAQPAMAGAPAAVQGWKNAIPTAYNLGTGLFDDQQQSY